VTALPRVLVADDSEAMRALVVEWLASEAYEVVCADDGPSTMAAVEKTSPDVLLVDHDMPGFGGIEVCRRLRQDPTRHLLPIVMVSGFGEVTNRVAALDAGADDFLGKPIERSELVARVRSLVRLNSARARLEDARRVVFALARAVEAKDLFTVAHAERVSDQTGEMAEHLGLDSAEIAQMRAGALIHDIGKIVVPDSVLNKAGPLTEEEFENVKRHCTVGSEIVAPLASQSTLVAIVRSHHERYDGAGYPDRLAGEQIALGARIVAICDAFDAMVYDRPYRHALSRSEANAVLAAGRNNQWDGRLVDVFLGAAVAGRVAS